MCWEKVEKNGRRYLWEENRGAARQGEYGFSTGINPGITFAFHLLWSSVAFQKQTELWEKEAWDDLPLRNPGTTSN